MTASGLDARRVLVTGAAHGIGRRTAAQLVERGARVALVDRDADAVHAAAAELGPAAVAVRADVTDATQLDKAVAQAADELGGLDVVVANAGIAPRRASTVERFESDELERVMAVNVTGAWNTARAGVRHLRAGGRLVIVASVYAYSNGAFMAPYAASKAAVESLGRSLRVELAPRKIGVTIAYFGPVDTGFAHAFDHDPIAHAVQDAFPSALVHRITPEQAAAAVVMGIERGRARVITPAALDRARTFAGPCRPRRRRRPRPKPHGRRDRAPHPRSAAGAAEHLMRTLCTLEGGRSQQNPLMGGWREIRAARLQLGL